MNTPSLRTLCCATALSLAAVPAAAEVVVRFVEPEHFTDAGEYGFGAERNLAALERHLKTLGKRCLAAEQRLDIQIVDIDLAGQHEWWRTGGRDLRIMSDVTWPRADIRYRWTDAQGEVLADGSERVADMNYLARSNFVRADRSALAYDKAMLGDWFERRFCPQLS